MAEKWYDELPDDAFVTETDIAYKEAVKRSARGLRKGLISTAPALRYRPEMKN